MNVSGAGVKQSVDMWALMQSLSTQQMQATTSVAGEIVNQLESLDSDLGQNLDVSI